MNEIIGKKRIMVIKIIYYYYKIKTIKAQQIIRERKKDKFVKNV